MHSIPTDSPHKPSLSYGARLQGDGVQFDVFSRDASGMRVLLYQDVDDLEPFKAFDFDPVSDRIGDVWSLFIPGLKSGQLYHFQASGPNDLSRGLRFRPANRLIDPYAKALAGKFQPMQDGVSRPPKCVVVDDQFDWDGDSYLKHDMAQSVIYELHVRGFTQDPSSQVKHPGTYLGLAEKIPYLQSLGVTAVELMPIHEFPTNEFDGTQSEHPNYWGYDPLAFFAPHRGYSFDQQPGGQVREFKQMVKAFHAADIEVILDVVFNHTCEGNHRGPVLSLKGLANPVYYMLESEPSLYRNYSGCGNSVNGNHPICSEMILQCLRYWVQHYHVDGFRFDLASVLSRDQNGNLMSHPPLIESISEDPFLADTKLIAEAWDAAGAYQIGEFGNERWSEWNGKYRDDVRRYWRGDPGTRGALATRLAGSADLYQTSGRSPSASVNFITSHDGFTLNDLVSYQNKHNLANGENNNDGDNNNFSQNFGVEGPTEDSVIQQLRSRQTKNLLATLLLSQGVPMLVAGDEFRRTQKGNNNAYCQDNDISWLDWSLANTNEAMLRFTSVLIQFRRNQPTLRRPDFLTGQATSEGVEDVRWFNVFGLDVEWKTEDLPIGCLLRAPAKHDERLRSGQDLLFLFNSTSDTHRFAIPDIIQTESWNLFVDTSLPDFKEIFSDGNGPRLGNHYSLPGKSTAVFLAKRRPIP